MAHLRFASEQIAEVEDAREEQLHRAPREGANARVLGPTRLPRIGIETADMLVREAFAPPLRDRGAVARYPGLTGAPSESGKQRREQGLAKAGKARVRRGMIPLAWRFLRYQKESGLTQWYAVV